MRAAAWAAVFLVALAIRLAALAWHPPAWDGDQQTYASLAASCAAGEGYWPGRVETHVHPLLPSLHAAVLRTMPGLPVRTAGILLTVVVSALLPVVAGGAVAALTTVRAGWIAAALLALQPHHVLRAGAVEPDLLCALLLSWGALALAREELALAGTLFGLGYLDRPEVFFLALGALVWLIVRGVRVRLLWRFLLPFLSLAAIFVLYVHAQTGRWTLSGKDRWAYQQGVHQWRERGAPLPVAAVADLKADVPSVLGHLEERPGEFVLGYLYRAGLLLRNLGRQLAVVLVVPAVWGSLLLWREDRRALFLLGFPLLALPALALVGTFFRHAIPPAVALLLLAAVGLDRWRG